jgi:cytochrome P450
MNIAVKAHEKEAHDAAYALPLDKIDVAQPILFQNDAMWPYFERLRKEDPVHFCAESEFGPYWSITKYNDIMAVDTNHQVFSSEYTLGGITIGGGQANVDPLPMFIAMDPPKHDIQRKVVTPVVSPANLTAMTLATLFDFPFEERRKLSRWSDVVTAAPGHGIVDTLDQKMAEMQEYNERFTALWNERVNASEVKGDLISMLAHNPATRNMEPREYFGNVVLLTVGGNDTTRNTISGSVVALNQNPGQYKKLRDNPDLIIPMVSETIRWQTPLAHMRRTAKEDTDFQGKRIRKGDKVVMWYVSGNRDDTVIERPNDYIIDRENSRRHISFGFGIHRCVGNRLAELQLQIIWEEILKRFPVIEQVGAPKRSYSTFVKGYEHLDVVIPKRN